SSDLLAQSWDSLRVHRLRAALTILGLTMGVATIITVMTLIQGANRYVEQKIANLGTNVFQIAKTPFATTDFDQFLKSVKYKRVEFPDLEAVARRCRTCRIVGGTVAAQTRARFQDAELQAVDLLGHTANMAEIDTRTVERGRYFTDSEDSHSAQVCLIGDSIRTRFFPEGDPTGRVLRVGSEEFTIVGSFERMGAVLGRDADSFIIIPMQTFLRLRGARNTITINVLVKNEKQLADTIDEARQIMRGQRHVAAGQEDDFFIGTRDSYIALWQSISGAFFAVFIMVSAISSFVGGIVIMNVMLVSVTERTKEIGIRRAMGATQDDIRRQFLTESVMQCLAGGTMGIFAGFVLAYFVRAIADFPVDVELWVAALGIGLSTIIGLFFGIYPAVRASRLDPVDALRSE
ncbi:MAG: ABC transporter permease, partial [Bryobacteraceae bacterium]|nr:ABC transporter permease [Bryobacteraceae bacterium]